MEGPYTQCDSLINQRLYYKFETGEVFAYNPTEGQFLPLAAELAQAP